jgi:hypothetical protein
MLRFENASAVYVLSTLEAVVDDELLSDIEVENLKDSFTRDDVAVLFQRLASMDMLESVSLVNCKIRDVDFEEMTKVLIECAKQDVKIKWKKFNLSGNALTDGIITKFEQFLQLCGQTIQHLNLDGNPFTLKFHRKIMPLLCSLLPNLSSLDLRSQMLKTVVVDQCGNSVPNSAFLEMLTLAAELCGIHTSIRNMNLSRYFYVVDGILHIRYFPLTTVESLGVLTLVIHQLHGLQGIVCNHCALSDDAMDIFCEALSVHHGSLKHIELKYNSFTDSGATKLAELVKLCRQVNSIIVSGNEVFGEGLRLLWIAALNHCRSLELFLANDLLCDPPANIIALTIGDFFSARFPLQQFHDARIGSCIIRRNYGLFNIGSIHECAILLSSTPWDIVMRGICFEDEEMRLLAIPLMRNTSTVSLSFLKCKFSDRCLDDLSRAVSVNSSLERLQFLRNENVWSSEGMGFILKALETNRSLRWIVLDKPPKKPSEVVLSGNSNYKGAPNGNLSFQTPSAKFTSPDIHDQSTKSHIQHPYRTDRSPLFSAFKSSSSVASASTLMSVSEAFLERFLSNRLPAVMKSVKCGTVYLHRPSIVSKFFESQEGSVRRKLLLSPHSSLETTEGNELAQLITPRASLLWSQYRLQHQFNQQHRRNNLRFASQKVTSMFRLAQVVQVSPVSPGNDENWLTLCVSDYSEEELKQLLLLLYEASERICLTHIRLTYVPFPCRFLLVPFLCRMLANSNICRNLESLILGDFIYFQDEELIVKDWDLGRSWEMQVDSKVDAHADLRLDELEYDGPATPMKSITPTLLSPTRKSPKISSPSAKTLLNCASSERMVFPKVIELQESNKVPINDAKTDQNSSSSIAQFTDGLTSFSERLGSVQFLATDTAGLSLSIALTLLQHLIDNKVLHLKLFIKENELDIRGLLGIVAKLSSLSSDFSVSVNNGIIDFRHGRIRIEQHFFCGSRPCLQFSLRNDASTIQPEHIRAIEDVLFSMEMYAQDMVEIDPALLSSNDSAGEMIPGYKMSILWIDRINSWLLEHQDTQRLALEAHGSTHFTFFPHVYVDNPRLKDPLESIHRDVFWSCYSLELLSEDASKLCHVLHVHQETKELSFINIRLTDASLRKILNASLSPLAVTISEDQQVDDLSNCAPIYFVRNVLHLDLSHNQLSDDSLLLISKVFFASSESNLRSLNLSYNSNFTVSGIQQLLSSIAKLKQISLTSLLLHNTVIREERNYRAWKDEMVLTDYFPFSKSIAAESDNDGKKYAAKPTEVILTQAMIDLLLAHSFLDQVKLTSHIQFSSSQLEISSYSDLLRQETQGIALVCASRPYITHLLLRHNCLQDDQMVDLSAAVQFLTALEVLDVSHNVLTNSGMSLLAETLLVYGNPSTFRYVDFSYNASFFIVPNVHQAIENHFFQTQGTGMSSTSAWQPQRKLSYLKVLQFDNCVGDEKFKTKLLLKNKSSNMYHPYVFVVYKPINASEEQDLLEPVAFSEDISGGDILADFSDLVISTSSGRANVEQFLLHGQRLFHQYQHNISTNAPICTLSLILDRTILDSNFYANFSKFIGGIVTLSLESAGIDDTKAMHLEYALSRNVTQPSVVPSQMAESTGASSCDTSTSSLSTSASAFVPSLLSISLRSLQLQRNFITEVGAQALLACAGQSSTLSLRTLSFAENPLIRDLASGENLARFASKRLPSSLVTSPALLSLDLSYTSIEETTASLLSRTLAHPHCLLEALNVSFTQISANSGLRLLQALNTNRGLKTLAMDGISMRSFPSVATTTDKESTPNSSTAFNIRLHWKNCQLQSLSLRHCQLHPRIVHSLLDSGNRSLEHVDISHNSLPNVIVMMILLKLSTAFPQLQYLHLYQGTLQSSMHWYDPRYCPPMDQKEYGIPTISDVNIACTREDIEMLALEILQDSEVLKKLVLYPFEVAKDLPKRSSSLLRGLYEDEKESLEHSANLYPDSEYCRHYFDASARRLSMVIREDVLVDGMEVEERQRIGRSVFQNPHYENAEEITMVILSSKLFDKEEKEQSHRARKESNQQPSTPKGLLPSHHAQPLASTGSTFMNTSTATGSFASKYAILQLFYQSLFFVSSQSHNQKSLQRLTWVFSVLYEEDLIGLSQVLRSAGNAIPSIQLNIFCGTFVPLLAAHSASKVIAMPSLSYTRTANDASISAITGSSSVKRFSTPVKLRSPSSLTASRLSTNPPAAAASASNLLSNSLAVSKLTPSSPHQSFVDSLCLVSGVKNFSLTELGEDISDSVWHALVLSVDRECPSSNNNDHENTLTLKLSLPHFTSRIVNGIAGMIHHHHSLSKRISIVATSRPLFCHKSSVHYKSNRPMRTITKEYLAKQVERYEKNIEIPARHMIAEKLFAALIPSTTGVSMEGTSTEYLQLKLPDIHPKHTYSSSELQRKLRQEILLMDLLAMLLRRDSSLIGIDISGVFGYSSCADTVPPSVTSSDVDNDASTAHTHKLLDFDQAVSSVVLAIVQNEHLALQELALCVPSPISLQDYVHLFAPYLPAHVNDQLNPASSSSGETHDIRAPSLTNGQILGLIGRAFSVEQT